MQQTEVKSVDDQLQRLKRQITDPEDHRLLMLAEKIKADHTKVQEALNYAEIPEDDYQKLLDTIKNA